MSLFRPTFESSPSATSAKAGVQHTSEILGEAIMASVSSVRDSLPKEHHAYFETLRQEIIDFAQAHGIPREALSKSDTLRKAVEKLSIPELKRLANLLERFEHLIVKKEPWKNTEALEYVETFYHLEKQYTFQLELLKQAGILHPKKESKKTKNLSTFFRSLLPFGKKKRPEVPTSSETSEIFYIIGIDGNEYPIPTLEQIAARLFERREELKIKHDQGFTKLLLVPFGMSLDSLREIFKQFLLSYKKSHPAFELNTNEPLWTWKEYQGGDIGDSLNLVYRPQSFTKEGHGGKTKIEILEGQETPGQARGDDGWKGWTIRLLQPSNPDTQDTETSTGIAPVPSKGLGTSQGDIIPRPPLEAGQSPDEYLSIFQEAKEDKDSPYHNESGLTPEDWIIAFMTHLQETGQPLDSWSDTGGTIPYLTGAFFPSSLNELYVYWYCDSHRVNLGGRAPRVRVERIGLRSSVMI